MSIPRMGRFRYILMRKTAIQTDPGLLGPCRKPRASWRGPTCFQRNTGGGQRFIVLARFFCWYVFLLVRKEIYELAFHVIDYIRCFDCEVIDVHRK